MAAPAAAAPTTLLSASPTDAALAPLLAASSPLVSSTAPRDAAQPTVIFYGQTTVDPATGLRTGWKEELTAAEGNPMTADSLANFVVGPIMRVKAVAAAHIRAAAGTGDGSTDGTFTQRRLIGVLAKIGYQLSTAPALGRSDQFVLRRKERLRPLNEL